MLRNIAILAILNLAAVGEAATKPWKAAGPNDSRGPCPMLNTFANHGYLAHNGKNLSAADFGNAVVEALNTVPEYGTVPANMFIKGWGSDRFDLADLNTPGILQHIGSLSRDDVTESQPNMDAVPGRIAALLEDSPDSDHVDAASIARTRLRVEALSKPKKLSNREQLLAFVESSLVLMMMRDGAVPSALSLPSSKTWTAPKERVRVWLSEERLPEELGWTRSERQLQARLLQGAVNTPEMLRPPSVSYWDD